MAVAAKEVAVDAATCDRDVLVPCDDDEEDEVEDDEEDEDEEGVVAKVELF